ncbi:hypothetical protein XELAEV_18034196mg [Xenopus laevis]|uniref:Uncharacterized protein n=1 Tax=Xenopus laevis TaxID=8355 RepID=A0A974CDN2_XENLA|nr:hypothetical protein XELAEV_18034196mg [Xenopus laevis]
MKVGGTGLNFSSDLPCGICQTFQMSSRSLCPTTIPVQSSGISAQPLVLSTPSAAQLPLYKQPPPNSSCPSPTAPV